MLSTSFHNSVYPHPVENTLVIPKVLADQVGSALSAKGHDVVVTPLQKPYGQQPSGAGAVKMVMIDPRTGLMAAGVSPAKDDYALGWRAYYLLAQHHLRRVDRLYCDLFAVISKAFCTCSMPSSRCVMVGFKRTRPEATRRTVCSRCASVLMSGNK